MKENTRHILVDYYIDESFPSIEILIHIWLF